MDINTMSTKDLKVLLFDLSEEIKYKQQQYTTVMNKLVEKTKEEIAAKDLNDKSKKK